MPQPASIENIWTGQHTDGGPLYTEARYGELVVEPFNAVSAALFFLLACSWMYRTRARLKSEAGLAVTLVLLAVGGVGGTLYHAFRAHQVFHLLDVVPIGLIGLGWSVVFLRRVFELSWQSAFIVDILLAVGGMYTLQLLPMQLAVSGMYVLLAALVLGPIAMLYVRGQIHSPGPLLLSLGFFAVGLTFRLADSFAGPFLSMGTHWLWHIFCVFAVHNWLRFVATSGSPSLR